MAELPLVSTPTGCAYQGMLSISALFWMPGLIFEPILFMLVIIRVYQDDASIPLLARMKRGR